MVFNLSNNLISFVLGFLILWLAILTFLLLKTRSHYNKLTQKTRKETLTESLEEILKKLEISDQKIIEIFQRIEKEEKEGLSHIQKVGLLRFNPFEEVGGDQSFVFALLDDEDNGIVLTSLTSRTGTRWYGKSVKNGKGVEHELSKEEVQAVKKAGN